TDFSELGASYAIHDGIATSTDIEAKSPLLRIGGKSTVDLVDSSLDTTLEVSVVGTLTGQNGRDLSQLHGVQGRVELKGPFDKLAYTIDWRDLALQLAKAKAGDVLKQAVTPQQRDQLKNQLKNLLGGGKKQ